LNTSRPILPVGGLAEARVAGLGVEASELPRSIECVEELHLEDGLYPLRNHRNLFGEVQIFIVAGEFANCEGARCVAKGEVRRGDKGRRIQSETLPKLKAAAVLAIEILARNDIGTGGGAKICPVPGENSRVPTGRSDGERRSTLVALDAGNLPTAG
jgi:hypothetical protein